MTVRLHHVLVAVLAGLALAVPATSFAQPIDQPTDGPPTPPVGQDPQLEPTPEPSSSSSSVFTPDESDETSTPLRSGSGIDELLRGPDLRRGDAGTLYEVYGLSGLQLVQDEDVFDFTDGTLQQIPDVVWSVATWIVGVAGSMTQWAFSFDAFESLAPVVDSAVGDLYRGLFRPLLLPLILLTGAWAGWQLLRRRGSSVVQGAVWSIVVIGLAYAFLARPGTVTRTTNQVSIGLSRQILGTVARTSGGDPVVADVIPDPATYSGSDDDRALRQASDQLYRQTLVVPWMLMNFGSLDTAATPRPDDPEGNPTYAAGLLDYLTVEPGEDEASQQEHLEALLADVRQEPGAAPWIQGDEWTGRLALAAIALIGAVALGGVVLVVAGGVLIAQLGLVLAVLASPLFLLFGAWPGGRHIFRRFVGLAGSLLLRRIAYAAILAILLVAIDAIAADTSALSYGFSVAIQVLLVGAAIYFRGDILELFQPAEATHTGDRQDVTARLKSAGRRTLNRATALATGGAALAAGAAAEAAERSEAEQQQAAGQTSPVSMRAGDRAMVRDRAAGGSQRADRHRQTGQDARRKVPSTRSRGGPDAERDERWIGRVYQPGDEPPPAPAPELEAEEDETPAETVRA